MKIDNNKLEDIARNIGVVFTSSSVIGFFFKFSVLGSFLAFIVGIVFILFGIKESNYGN